MDTAEVDRLARVVARKTRKKYWYMDRAVLDCVVSEAYDTLLTSLHDHPEWVPGRHINNAVRSAAKEYYRGPGRDLFQTRRQAERREPGRRVSLPVGFVL